MTEPADPGMPIDFDAEFDNWIAGATVSRRHVTLYAKPGLYAEFQQVERDLELALAEQGEDTLATSPEVAALRRRKAEIYDEWVASKSDWIVRASSDADWTLVKDGDPARNWDPLVEPGVPEKPTKPVLPAKASETAQRSHTVKLREYEAAKAEYDEHAQENLALVNAYLDEVNLRLLELVVLEVRLASGAAGAVTVDQLKKWRKAVGERQMTRLLDAASEATKEEPEIPAPF